MFFTLFGDWLGGGRGGGSPNGVVDNLLMQFFALYSSKIKVSHQPGCVKHVLGIIYVFFTQLDIGCGGGGGGANGIHTQPAHAVFQPIQLKNRSFGNLFF